MADTTNPTTTTPPPDEGGKPKSLKSYLKGLTFRTNKQVEVLDEQNKPVMVGGKPRMKYIPVERELQEGDVLKAYESEGEMVIVTKDGRKYRIKK